MAFYSNSLNFPNLTVKGSPVGADTILIADSAGGGAPKQALISTLPFAPLGGSTIVNVTSATQAMAIDTTYFVNYVGGACTLTLPSAASSSQGAFIAIRGGESAVAAFVLASNASQQMRMLGNLTTATSGTLTADGIYDSITLECNSLSGGLVWNVVNTMGSFNGT